MSVKQNLCCICTHHEILMCQWVAVDYALEMAQVLDAERQSMEQIIEEKQTHRVQMTAPSQMQLKAMQRVYVQEKELWRLSALLVEHQEPLKYLPERPCQEITMDPPENLSHLRHEVMDYPPSMVNTNRGAASKTGQVHDLRG